MDESTTLAAEARRGQVALALLLALLAAVLIVPLATDDGDGTGDLRPLGLVPGGAGAETAAMDQAMPFANVRYVLEGDLPDLGGTAPVYELLVPELDAERVGEIAAAFGIDGAVRAQGEGFVVESDGLWLEAFPSQPGWVISAWRGGLVIEEGPALPESTSGGAPGAVGGSSSGACAAPEPGTEPVPCDDAVGIPVDPEVESCSADIGPDGEVVGESCTGSGVGTPIDPDAPTCVEETSPDGVTSEYCRDVDPDDLPPPIDLPEPPPIEEPEDLPGEAEAEQIARDALGAAGLLDGDWAVEVTNGAAMGWAVACASDGPCPEQDGQEIVLSRNVTFTRVVDGRTVQGLTWSVEVGDRGVIDGFWGVHADLEPVGDYPLRPIDSAYAALVAGEVDPWGGFGGPVPLGLPVDGGYDVSVMSDPGPVTAEVPPIVVEDCDAVFCAEPVEPFCDVPGDCGPAVVDADGTCPPRTECVAVPDPSCGPADDCEPILVPVTTLPDGTPAGEPTCVVPDDGSRLCEPIVAPGEPCPELFPAPDVGDPAAPALRPDATRPPTDGPGVDIVEVPPCEPFPTEPLPPIDEPPFEPPEIVVTVTGAELGAMVVPAVEDGRSTAYVVPSYRFVGRWDGEPGWSTDVLALDDAWISGPGATTTTAPAPPPTTEVPLPPEPTVTTQPPPPPPTTEPPATVPDTTEPPAPPSTTEPPPLPPTTERDGTATTTTLAP